MLTGRASNGVKGERDAGMRCLGEYVCFYLFLLSSLLRTAL